MSRSAPPTASTPDTDDVVHIGLPPARAPSRPIDDDASDQQTSIDRPPPGWYGRLRSTRQILTTVWIIASSAQHAVWMLTTLTTASIQSPWWLWTFAGGAPVIGGLRLLETLSPAHHDRPIHIPRPRARQQAC